jgi:phosphohistidine phosphatase SixA
MRLFWLGLLTLIFTASAQAQIDPGLLQAVKALQDGGHVIVFRHGATHADQADTDPLNIANVAKQRQLNDQGRALAREIGEAMRKLKIPVGRVITSQFNRAVETGTLLGFGAVTSTADITEGGLVVSPNENNRRTAAMKKLSATAPPAGTNVVLVSHKPNILDAFGKDWFDLREGEASIFKPDGNGGAKFVARVPAADWGKLAQATN